MSNKDLVGSSNFKEIYSLYGPKVYRICLGYFGNPEKAKDLTQDTFISVWNNLSSFKNKSLLGTWIFKIATNQCLRNLEKSTKIKWVELPDNLIEEKNIEQENSKEEKLNYLYQCIRDLPEMEKIIMILLLEDLPQAEISEIIGISEGNLRVKIHRIKVKLSLQFKNYGGFE